MPTSGRSLPPPPAHLSSLTSSSFRSYLSEAQSIASGKSVREKPRSSARCSLIKGGGRREPPYRLERLREPRFQEFAQLGCSLELWNGVQFLERGSERIRETPNRTRPKFLVLRLEVEVMHGASKVLRSLEVTLDERLVDDHLRSDIRQFTPLPGLHLLPHRLEVPLHSINANRDAVDERERLRVFREHGSKIPGKRHVRAHEHAILSAATNYAELVGRASMEWSSKD